jgi:hypothetical protein
MSMTPAGQALGDDDHDHGADDRQQNLRLNDARRSRHDLGAHRTDDAERGSQPRRDGKQHQQPAGVENQWG